MSKACGKGKFVGPLCPDESGGEHSMDNLDRFGPTMRVCDTKYRAYSDVSSSMWGWMTAPRACRTALCKPNTTNHHC